MRPEKQRKWKKRTRKSPKKAKPGAFWVLEGMGTVENGSNQMRKPRVRTKTNPKTMQHMQKENRQKPRVSAGFVAGAEGLGLGCRLGRAWTQPTGLQAPTTRTAGGPAGAPRCQILPHTNEKSQVPQKRYLTFLAGAEGLEPSARGFGVDVEERKRERGRGGVARFLLQDENVRCWFGAFRFSRSKTRIESPLEISLRMSSLKSYICMYTEE